MEISAQFSSLGWPTDTVVIDRQKENAPGAGNSAQKPVEPPMYHVFLNNDSTTPASYVTKMLAEHFSLCAERASQVMLAAHCGGQALVATMPKDIAETKVDRCNGEARKTYNTHFKRQMELTFSVKPA